LAPSARTTRVREKHLALAERELALVDYGQTVARGMLGVGSSFVKTLFDAAPNLRERLLIYAAQDPTKAVDLFVQLTKAIESVTRTGEKLIAVRRLIEGQPTSVIEHRTDAPAGAPVSDAEITRRAELVMQAIEARGAELRRDAGAPPLTDAEVVSSPDPASETSEHQ
jgi:hypothetical protein